MTKEPQWSMVATFNKSGGKMTYTLPPLYKKTSTGAIEEWQVSVEGPDIVTTYGHIDGKKQTARETAVGKNVGKANATTPEMQAQAQAVSEWKMKLARKGYSEDLAKAEAGENSGAGGIRPLLAQKYSERSKYAKFPGYAQPKFDGIRCIAVVKNGKASLWSREQKPIIGLPHVVKYLERRFPDQDLILDSEAYHHDYRAKFEEITSFVKQKTAPKPGHEVVQLHVYDLPSCKGGFASRFAALRELNLEEPLVLVETRAVANEEELMFDFEEFLAAGYEGAMFRNAEGEYTEGKRSNDLQKIKVMEDAEFNIVGVDEGVGKMSGLAIFRCATEEGKEFSVKMKGKLEELAKYLHDETLWQGRQLTVQFQNLTSDGIPRFPIGLRIRGDV